MNLAIFVLHTYFRFINMLQRVSTRWNFRSMVIPCPAKFFPYKLHSGLQKDVYLCIPHQHSRWWVDTSGSQVESMCESYVYKANILSVDILHVLWRTVVNRGLPGVWQDHLKRPVGQGFTKCHAHLKRPADMGERMWLSTLIAPAT